MTINLGEISMIKRNKSIEGTRMLILGTSSPQVDAIEYCQDEGLEVHACGHKKIGKGVEIADKFSLIDIKDKEKVLQYCEENDIDCVYSVGSELVIPTANHVSKRLGLPYFLEPEYTDLANDKTIWRDNLGDDFFGNIRYQGVKDKDDLSEWSKYPAIMKPSDGQGQRGVRPVNDLNEAKKSFDDVISYSGTNKIIIEEYIQGPELSVNAFVIDGEVIFFQESDRISYDEYPGGIIKEHRIPSKHTPDDKDLEDDIRKMTQEAVNRLSIMNGPVYIQLKLEEKRNPKIIEFTPRLDGCHIWRLIEHYSGANILDATFKLLFGQKEEAKEALEEIDKNGKYILRFMTEEPNETLNKEEYDLNGSLFFDWYYDEGEKVREINGFVERVGYKIIKNK